MNDLYSPIVRRNDSSPVADGNTVASAPATPGDPDNFPALHLNNLDNSDPHVERALIRGALLERATREQLLIDPTQVDAVLQRVADMGGQFHSLQPGARRAVIRQSLGADAPQNIPDVERFIEAAERILVERESARRQAIMNRPENVEAGREAVERGILTDAADAGKRIDELRARGPERRDDLLTEERDWRGLLARLRSDEIVGRLGAERAAALVDRVEKAKSDAESATFLEIKGRERERGRIDEMVAAARQSGIDRERARERGSQEVVAANDRAFAELLERNRSLLDGTPGALDRLISERRHAESNLRLLHERASEAAAAIVSALDEAPPNMEAFASALGKSPSTISASGSHRALVEEIDVVLAKTGELPLASLVERTLGRKPLERQMAARLIDGDFVGYEATILRGILERGEPSGRESILAAREDFRAWASVRSPGHVLRALSRHRTDANETDGHVTTCLERSLGQHAAIWTRALLNDMRTSHAGAMEASIFRERVDNGESFAVVAGEAYRVMTSPRMDERTGRVRLNAEYELYYKGVPAFEPDLVDLDGTRMVHSRANAFLADGVLRNDIKVMKVAVLMYGLGLYDTPDGKPAPANPIAIVDALGDLSPTERKEMLDRCARYLRSPGSIDDLLQARLGGDLKIWLDAKIEGNTPLEHAALIRAHLDPSGPDVSPILGRLNAEPLMAAEILLGSNEAERKSTLDAYTRVFGAEGRQDPLSIEHRMWIRGQLEGDGVAIDCARLRALSGESEESLSSSDILHKFSGRSAIHKIEVARLYDEMFPGADRELSGGRRGLIGRLRAEGVSHMYRDLTAVTEPRMDDYRKLAPRELEQVLQPVKIFAVTPDVLRRLLEIADKLVDSPRGEFLISCASEKNPLAAIANHDRVTRCRGGEEALYVAIRGGVFDSFEDITAAIESNVRGANPALADRLQSYAHAGRLWSFGFDARADTHLKSLPKEQQALVLHAAADVSTPELRALFAANFAYLKLLPRGDDAIYRNVAADPKEFVKTYGTHRSRELLDIAANHLSPQEIADISREGHLPADLAAELTRRYERKIPLATLFLTQDFQPRIDRLLADPALAHLREVYDIVAANRRDTSTDRQCIEEAAMVCRYLYSHGLAPNETNVRQSRRIIEEARSEAGKIPIFRGRHTIAVLNNEEISGTLTRFLATEVQMFDKTPTRRLLTKEITKEGTLRVLKAEENSRTEMRKTQGAVLAQLRATPTDKPLTFFFNGHGTPEQIWIGNASDETGLTEHDCSISVRQLAIEYIARVRGREGGPLPSQPDIFFFHCCHSHEIGRNFYGYLPPDIPKPVIISAAEFGQYGYASLLDRHGIKALSALEERAKMGYLHLHDFMRIEHKAHANPTILIPDLVTPARRDIKLSPPGDFLQISRGEDQTRSGADEGSA